MVRVDKATATPDLTILELPEDYRNAVRAVHNQNNLYNFKKHLDAHLALRKDPKKRLEDFEKKWNEFLGKLSQKQADLFNAVHDMFPNSTPQDQLMIFANDYNTWLHQQGAILSGTYPDVYSKVTEVVNNSIRKEELELLKQRKKQLKEQEKALRKSQKSKKDDSGSEGELSDLDETAEDFVDEEKKKKKKKKKRKHRD